jgi:hypothetical protein
MGLERVGKVTALICKLIFFISFCTSLMMPLWAHAETDTASKKSGAGSVARAGKKTLSQRPERQKIYKKEDCVALTDACRVCPDATLVGPNLKSLAKPDARECLKKGRSKLLALKASEVYFSKAKGVNCQRISSLCALCPDQVFVSPESDRVLSTDLYECVSGPRTRVFNSM